MSEILPSEVLGFCPSSIEKATTAFRKVFRFCQRLDYKKCLVKDKKISTSSKRKNELTINNYSHVQSYQSYINYMKELIVYRCFSSDMELSIVS